MPEGIDPEQGSDGLVYDWNLVDSRRPIVRGDRVTFFDESLRDGIQSPSVFDPPIEEKLRILHLMDALGIEYADIGLPGAGPRAVADVTALTQEIVSAGLKIRPAAAARTHLADIRPIAEISQKTGVAIEVMAFLGSSPIRQYAENWEVDRMVSMTTEAIDFCRKEGLPATFVTEDTVRSRPETLDRLFRTAIDHGATRLTLCDTVGHATPDGVRAIVKFAQSVIAAMGVRKTVLLDWHGHNDRGLALVNAIVALEAGVERLHGTALGIGERVGNTSMDQLLMNLRLLGVIDRDLTRLGDYCDAVSRATRVPVPVNYPLIGADAFRTATGVHAAAIIKAQKKGDTWLADRIYSGVPAGLFGRGQIIELGPMSGLSNVHYWLQARRIAPSPGLAEAIFAVAKASDHTLSDTEIAAIIDRESVGQNAG